MNTSNNEKSHVFSDKRGQDRRKDTARAQGYKNDRRKADRRTMEFSESPWWLQRNYVNVNLSPAPSKPRIRRKLKPKAKVN